MGVQHAPPRNPENKCVDATLPEDEQDREMLRKQILHYMGKTDHLFPNAIMPFFTHTPSALLPWGVGNLMADLVHL